MALCAVLLGTSMVGVFCGAEVYDGKYPGARRALTNTDSLADHTVQGITPAGTTVNLFDYDPQIGNRDNDLLPDGAKFENYSKGINENALLLFGGSAMREAGFWNLGSGAGRPWGQNNVNMKGIVKSTLKDNYPYINLDQARSTLQNPTVPIITEDGPWGDPNRKLMDIANLNHAESENAGVDKARALSVKLLKDRGLTVADDGTVSGDCEKASLSYLFDPDTTTDGKKSYQNVTGLFQVDKDGYYYYNARKNFAEFTESHATTEDGTQSDGSFTLYDGPAVWRTDAGYNPDTNIFDGEMSLGNFFPFDSASKVFDSIQTKDKNGNETNILSSSEKITNVSNAAKANHYMGMTMQVDFTQPENGKLNMGSKGKQPMVFQFSGDDDVWVFIDDVLVLDLGGVHSELYGTIDFSTGKVITGQSWRIGGLPDNPGSLQYDEKTTLYDLFVNALGQDKANKLHWINNNGNMIFPTSTEHQLKIFYLERGNYDSSLQMRFNLQPFLYHGIKKVDQNGDPLEGVAFELYAATTEKDGSTDVADYKVNGDAIGTLTTDKDGKTTFTREDGSPFSFTDQYHVDGTLYYILRETKTAGGYRALPKDIVLEFNPDTSMLVVANRYQTGAYASFFSNIRETGTITYGQFNEQSGVIASSDTELRAESKEKGLIVAVPMLLEENMSHDEVANDGKWQALYGSNTEGYGAVAPAERTAKAWRKAVLKAALYQASDERWPEWRLTYNQDTGRLEGLLEDLPGRADRYALNNPAGDMKMVYGVIELSALTKLGITGTTSAKLYDALEAYVSNAVETGVQNGKSSEEVIDEIIAQLDITEDSFERRDFSFLNTDQFQREFRSTIYIPNERRELRVQKVDEDGKGVNGAEFTLTGPDDSTITGTTAKVDGQDGVLIFRPDAPENMPGYARVKWAEVNSKYTLKETSAPMGYKLNPTEIPVVVGVYSTYADAGTKDDGVTVMAGVGKLMQTMTKYAADDMVNITLRDITAIAQTQKAGSFDLNGWKDDLLAGTQIPRSMNLHYGINTVVDYGLHDEDGGKIIYPFFTTDEGFLRTRVEQNTNALENELYEGSRNTANWDNLRERDLTSLFSLLNTVVVTDRKTTPKEETGKLRISKTVYGENLPAEEYTHNFTFKVSLKKPDGTPLEGAYYYYGEQLAGYIEDGEKLPLHHDEALTILGLPSGTKWEITETPESGWSIVPESGIISGTIEANAIAEAAFINYEGDTPPAPKTGNLTVSKTVAGNAGETDKEFHFTVTLGDTTVGGKYGDMTFTGGKATFTLKHNERKTATGLPAGITYTVTEDDYSDDGYVATKIGDTGTIAKDGTSTAVFTNTKDVTPIDPDPDESADPDMPTGNVPKTGENLTLWLVLLGISGMSEMIILLSSKRKYGGKYSRKK
ncbi:MAG: fibro-slime domain-containing protein [bacterium]|nr:fibro-slime domain-containing protein [bacterium]